MTNQASEVLQGDCLELMRDIPDGSIDLILTDPPYGTMNGASLDGWSKDKTYWDVVIDQNKMLDECNRVLRMNGALILFSQEPYTSKLITEPNPNLPFSYRLVWKKDHFANALVAKVAPVSYFEDICVFFKKYDLLSQHPLRDYSRQIMQFANKSLKEINKDLGNRRAEHFFYVDSTQFGLCTKSTYDDITRIYNLAAQPWFKSFEELSDINRRFERRFERRFNLPGNKKYLSNILEYKKDYSGLHPTQKPVALLESLVNTYSNEGDTVLDFTMGSGSTGVACQNTNRNFIGIELDKEYFEIAKKRLAENGTTQKN